MDAHVGAANQHRIHPSPNDDSSIDDGSRKRQRVDDIIAEEMKASPESQPLPSDAAEDQPDEDGVDGETSDASVYYSEGEDSSGEWRGARDDILQVIDSMHIAAQRRGWRNSVLFPLRQEILDGLLCTPSVSVSDLFDEHVVDNIVDYCVEPPAAHRSAYIPQVRAPAAGEALSTTASKFGGELQSDTQTSPQ
jgi:hypothetical protein